MEACAAIRNSEKRAVVHIRHPTRGLPFWGWGVGGTSAYREEQLPASSMMSCNRWISYTTPEGGGGLAIVTS